MSALDDEAAQWASENGGAPVPVPPQPPSDSASAPQSEAAPEPESPKRTAKEQHASNEVISRFLVGALDMMAVKLIGPRMKLDDSEREQLVTLAAPVVEKYLPDVEAGPETLLLGGLLLVYAPKYLTPEPPSAVASPAGGSDDKRPSSGTPTAAAVDGRPVEAQVLQ